MTNLLYSNFDLTAKAIPRILSLKGDLTAQIHQRRLLREKFIRFYLAFIANSSVVVRRDLVSQKNVITGWFRYINEDSPDLIYDSFNLLTKYVIRDSGFTKPMRMNLFNDWVLGHISILLNRTDSLTSNPDIKISKFVFDFMKFLVTDTTLGLKYNDKQWYLPDSEQGESGDRKVNNKLLGSFLKILKPWDSSLKQDIALEVMSTSPELVAPYFSEDWPFPLDPKLTMFWISSMLFFSKAIQLPIPSSLYSSPYSEPPNVKIICEHILPQPLSKQMLSKSLLSDIPLIKYHAFQIMIFAFNKLESVIDLYKKKGWEDKYYTLLEEITMRLPEIPTIITSITTIAENQIDSMELLKSVAIRAIASYSKLLPETFLKSKFVMPPKLMTALEADDFSNGLQLVNLQNVLEVQTRLGGVGKWWNKSGNLPYSLFTVLARVATLLQNDLFTNQIENLIKYLCHPYLIFQEVNSKMNPVNVFLNSLIVSTKEISEEERVKIWKLLDESVSRSIRSPYKYLDIISASTNNVQKEAIKISPFIAVLIEQWRFVDKTSDYSGVKNWLARFLRDSIITGCKSDILCKLLEKEKDPDLIKISNLLKVESNFSETQEKWKPVFDKKSTPDLILNTTKPENFGSLTLKTPFDLYTAKFRLKYEQKSSIKMALFAVLTKDLSSSLKNILATKDIFIDILADKSLWENFFLFITTNKFEHSAYLGIQSYLVNTLIPTLSISEQLSLFKYSIKIFDDLEYLKSKIDDLRSSKSKSNDLLELQEFLYIHLLKKSRENFIFSESDLLSCFEFAGTVKSNSLFISLKEYIGSLKTFSTAPEFLELALKFSKLTEFSSSQLLSVLIRNVPHSDLSLLHKFTDGDSVDDLTFLSALTEILSPTVLEILDKGSDESLVKIYNHGIEISISALDSKDTISEVLLETIINFLKKIMSHQFFISQDTEQKTLIKIIRFIAIYNGKKTVSPGMIYLVREIASRFTGRSKISVNDETLMKPLRLWAQRTITWLAKRLAEDDQLGKLTKDALDAFYNAFTSPDFLYPLNPWLLVPTASLNTLLEIAATRYIESIEVVKFICAMIPTSRVLTSAYYSSPNSSNKHLPIEFTKLLQIVLNNERSIVAMEIGRTSKEAKGTGICLSYIISTLFHIDVTRHSTKAIQEKVLTLCMGTYRAQDVLLIEILKKIESRISYSFCNAVVAWDITTSSSLSTKLPSLRNPEGSAPNFATGSKRKREEDKTAQLEDILIGGIADETEELDNVTPLFLLSQTSGSSSTGFEVSFDAALIENSIYNFDSSVPQFQLRPLHKNSRPVKETFQQFLQRYNQYSLELRSEMTYDTEFFLLLVTSSNILVQKESHLVVDNLRVFVESGILSLVIASLCHKDENISKIALSLLVAARASVQHESYSNYPDKEIVEIITNKIFSYITSRQEQDPNEPILVPSFICLPIAVMIQSILSQPEHNLYEKVVFGYLLSGPSITTNSSKNEGNIPLFHAISRSTNTSESYGDSLLKDLIWLTEMLTASLVDSDALNAYSRRGVFEWALNLSNLLPLPPIDDGLSGWNKSTATESQRDAEASQALSSAKHYSRSYNILVHKKIVQLFKRAQEIVNKNEDGSLTSVGCGELATKNGFVSWIHNHLTIFGNEEESNSEAMDYQLALQKLGARTLIGMSKSQISNWTLLDAQSIKDYGSLALGIASK